jgi:hypothetical protein
MGKHKPSSEALHPDNQPKRKSIDKELGIALTFTPYNSSDRYVTGIDHNKCIKRPSLAHANPNSTNPDLNPNIPKRDVPQKREVKRYTPPKSDDKTSTNPNNTSNDACCVIS